MSVESLVLSEDVTVPLSAPNDNNFVKTEKTVHAHLYGQPLFKLPQDLYIPPEALNIFLEAFEGPLDLLLYLIRKQNFNVLDIPMIELTGQYLAYVEHIRTRHLELAADYLLMAASLIEIKSRMLLPSKKNDQSEEGEDPRAELVRHLLEYEQIKLGAEKLEALPQRGRDFMCAQAQACSSQVPILPEINIEDLCQAWTTIVKRASLSAHHLVAPEQLSVREHMTYILRRLQGVQFIEFKDLLDERIQTGAPVAVMVVCFMAILELARETLLEITQIEPYAPIYLRLGYSTTKMRLTALSVRSDLG